VLRDAKQKLAASSANEVLTTNKGAHLANLSLAVQERGTALCDADQFTKRLVYGSDHQPLRAVDATVPDNFDPGAWGRRPPPTVPDVHVTIGLNKGGDPGSETIVLRIVNQKRPKNARKTILVAVCSYNKEKFPEVSAMMSIQSPRIDELLERGLDVRGKRRPVRLLLSG